MHPISDACNSCWDSSGSPGCSRTTSPSQGQLTSDRNSTYDPDSPLPWNRRFTSSGEEDADILVGGRESFCQPHAPPQARTLGVTPTPSTPSIRDPCKTRHSLGPEPALGRTMGPPRSVMGTRTQVLSRPTHPLLTSAAESPYSNALTLTCTSARQAGPSSPGSLLRRGLRWGRWHSVDAAPAILHPSPGCGQATLQAVRLVLTSPEAHVPLLSPVPGTRKMLPAPLSE